MSKKSLQRCSCCCCRSARFADSQTKLRCQRQSRPRRRRLKLDFCGVLLFLSRGCCSASRKSRIANPVSSSLLRTAVAAHRRAQKSRIKKSGGKQSPKGEERIGDKRSEFEDRRSLLPRILLPDHMVSMRSRLRQLGFLESRIRVLCLYASYRSSKVIISEVQGHYHSQEELYSK